MENYYTVANAASRLNCSRNTITRAIYNGVFTDVTKDTSCSGAPGFMIPSDQVEWWKDHGGILQKKSRKTGQEAGDISKILVRKPKEEKAEDDEPLNGVRQFKLDQAMKTINEQIVSSGKLTVNRIQEMLGFKPEPDNGLGWVLDVDNPPKKDTGKILIEIDASTIQKSVNDSFRKQIANLREAVSLISDELAKLEAMI